MANRDNHYEAAFEAYLSAFYVLRGLPFVAFRPVTIFGPNQYAGWLVPRVIMQAINGATLSISAAHDQPIRRCGIVPFGAAS